MLKTFEFVQEIPPKSSLVANFSPVRMNPYLSKSPNIVTIESFLGRQGWPSLPGLAVGMGPFQAIVHWDWLGTLSHSCY